MPAAIHHSDSYMLISTHDRPANISANISANQHMIDRPTLAWRASLPRALGASYVISPAGDRDASRMKPRLSHIAIRFFSTSPPMPATCVYRNAYENRDSWMPQSVSHYQYPPRGIGSLLWMPAIRILKHAYARRAFAVPPYPVTTGRILLQKHF